MNRKTFVRQAKQFITETMSSPDLAYSHWDGFMKDYPEDIDGESLWSIFEDLLATVEVEVFWDDGEKNTRVFPNEKDFDVNEEG